MSIIVQVCVQCAAHYFPFRELCPNCGGRSFGEATAQQGFVERVSALASGTILATVSIDLGPVVVARVVAPVAIGEGVALTSSSEITTGQAFVPSHDKNQ